MKEYDLYVALRSNRGVSISPIQLARLKKRLIKRFGGLTHFPQHNEGIWKLGGVVFRDEIVILRVLSEEDRRVQEFWMALKKDLKRRWRQHKVLIVVRDIALV
jgi:hypothetical protein